MFSHPVNSRFNFPGAIHLLVLLCAALAAPVQAGQISLSVADIVGPAFAARGVRVTLPEDGSAQFDIGELRVAQQVWRKVHLRCAEFSLTSERIACGHGRLDPVPGLQLGFSYGFDTKHLELNLSGSGESWQVSGDFRGKSWQATARLHNAQAMRLATLLPAAWPALSQGTLNGGLEIGGGGSGLNRASADLQLADLAFADASGLHAAEKLAGKLQLDATRTGDRWDWRGAVDWRKGELFWQPLYLHGGYKLQAAGKLQGDLLAGAAGRVRSCRCGQG